MRRTRDLTNRDEGDNRVGCSGLRTFDGEDLDYGDRSRMQHLQQNEYVQQQLYEKQMKLQQENDEEKMYAEQTTYINKVRGMLEEEQIEKKRTMAQSMRDANLQMAQEKKDKEKREKQEKLGQEQVEVDFTLNNATMTESRGVHANALSDWRVRTDHWKGMSGNERNAIMEEQRRQIAEKKQIKAMEKEEDRLWAMQAEANRGLLLANERDAQRKRAECHTHLRETHKAQRNEHNQKWGTDPYGEKGLQG